MNIRKEHDYSALFAGINQALRAELSQMKLYCELGKLICARSEKGAAVASAAYLAEKYPNQAGEPFPVLWTVKKAKKQNET